MGYVYSNLGQFQRKLINLLIPFLISLCLIACSGGGGGSPGGSLGDPSFSGMGEGLGPVGSNQADAPEGVLGSAPESVGLPSFDSVFMTWEGESQNLDKNARENLIYNLRALEGTTGQYSEDVNFRFHHENTYERGSEPTPNPPGCHQEFIGKDKIHVTCEGPFTAVNGFLIRLVMCGIPDSHAIYNHTQSRQNIIERLNEFLDRAWIKGETDLWDVELCKDRRYVDYVFYGSEAELNFPLTAGEMNFITLLPRDYLGKEAQYGLPNPNHLGKHNTTFTSNRQMNEYLYNAIIERVVVPFQPQRASANSPFASIPPGKSKNLTFGTHDTGTHHVAAGAGEVPNNAYCQEVTSWANPQVELEKEILNLVNKHRAQGGTCGSEGKFDPAPALNMNPTLRCAARKHSLNMFQDDFFAHVNPKGEFEWMRIGQAGFQANSGSGYHQGNVIFSGTGENIAMGFSKPDEALEEFLDSDDHCANLFNPNFTEIGVGYHPGGAKGPLLTVDFAKP